jgi:hypothetical protein
MGIRETRIAPPWGISENGNGPKKKPEHPLFVALLLWFLKPPALGNAALVYGNYLAYHLAGGVLTRMVGKRRDPPSGRSNKHEQTDSKIPLRIRRNKRR